MSLRSLLEDPIVADLLNCKDRRCALLVLQSDQIKMLAASKAYRDHVGYESEGTLITQRYSQLVCAALEQAMKNQQGWTGHVRINERWHLLQLWNHGTYSILFERRLRTEEFNTSLDLAASRVDYEGKPEDEPTSSVIDNADSVLIQLSNKGQIVRVNAALEQFVGNDIRQLQGLDASNLVFRNDLGHYKRLFNTVRLEDATLDGSFRLRNKSGEVQRFDWTAVSDGRGLTLVGKPSKKHLEEALVKSEERLNNILETMNEAFFAIDDQGFITYINAKGAELLGRNTNRLLGRLLWERAPALKKTPLFAHLNRTQGLGKAESFQWEDVHSNRWYQVKTYPSENLVSVFFTDISEIKKTENSAVHQAMHDSLTGLPNRLSLKQTLSELIGDQAIMDITMGLLFIDLDGFKAINDTMGHNTGDELLKLVAQRLQDCVRSSDLVARLSGDEFVITLPFISSPEDALNVGRKVVDQISKTPFELHKKRVYMGASVGVSIFPQDSQTVEGMLKNADIAMYVAKQAGKNTVRAFNQSMSTNLHARMDLEFDLHEALRDDRFELHYQPRFDTENQIVGAEALLRMRSETGDLISPADFIPLAEQNGLIVPLGKKVLEQACAWCKALNQTIDSPVHVSVNVSGAQLFVSNFPATVKQVLQETGLQPDYLELELTETMLMQNEERVINDLNTLHAMGVKLSVDDFGTGYSSLSLLQKMPVQTIKLDRSFVTGLPDQHDNIVISRSVCALAKAMGLGLVAEGVETPAQQQFLIHTGFDELQGFGLARPLPAQQATQFIQAIQRQSPSTFNASGVGSQPA